MYLKIKDSGIPYWRLFNGGTLQRVLWALQAFVNEDVANRWGWQVSFRFWDGPDMDDWSAWVWKHQEGENEE